MTGLNRTCRTRTLARVGQSLRAFLGLKGHTRSQILRKIILSSAFLAAGVLADSIRCPFRTAAWDTKNPQRQLGWFPAGAELESVGEEAGDMISVRWTSPSGKQIDALVRRADVGASASPAPAGADADTGSVYRPRNAAEVWSDIESSEMDRRAMSGRARKTADMPGMEWKTAHTDHFVIHYTHGMYARRVARLAEFLYHYISDDLGAPRDLVDGRSHIFIFRNQKEWDAFMKAMPIQTEWAFSYVEGMAMYLQQANDNRRSNAVLAHEMTHLVLNRFFSKRPPLWLNEGLAEWFELFGQAAFKGVKKSRRTEFRRLNNPWPVPELLMGTSYPQNTADVMRYYNTARFMVGFLRLTRPDEEFIAFIQAVMSGAEALPLLLKTYGFEDIDALAKAFANFHT